MAEIRITALGKWTDSYIGMCGARSSITRMCKVAESWRPWAATQVAGFIERFMNATRKTWPDWLPPQEPVFFIEVR